MKPDLAAALRGRAALAQLRFSSPTLSLDGKGADGGEAGLPAWLPAIGSGRLTAGEFSPAPGAPPALLSDCSFSYSRAGFRAERCLLSYEGAAAELSGSWDGRSAAASGRLDYPPGQLSLDFNYTLSAGRHALSASGEAGGAPLRLAGALRGLSWTGDLRLSRHVPLGIFGAGLAPLPLSHAEVSVSGTGLSPAAASGTGRFRAEAPQAAASGDFSFRPGAARFAASLSSGPVSALVSASFEKGRLSGAWEAAASQDLSFQAAGGLALAGFASSGTFSGELLAPAFRGAARAAGLAAGGLRAGPVTLDFEGKAGTPEFLDLRLSAADLSAGGAPASLLVTASGSRASHSFSVSLARGDSPAAAAGTGSLGANGWGASVNSLLLPAPGWRLCSPFSVAVSYAGETAVEGGCLANGGSQARFSGLLRGSSPAALRASLKDFDLALLEQGGLTSLRPEGLADAALDYSSGGPGSFSFQAAGLRLNGVEMGEAAAAGSLGPGSVLVDSAEWRIYGGSVKVSGSAGRRGGVTRADFRVEASTISVVPLLAFAPGLQAREAWLDGAAGISLDEAGLKTSGSISLTAPALAAPDLGLDLRGVRLELTPGEGYSAAFRGAASRGGGRLSAEGELSAAGPAIVIRASALPFSHPSGLSGKASGQLVYDGGWRSPSLRGKVFFDEARLEAERWDKYRPSAEPSPYFESMDLDVAVKADRNAWYRDGTSSVELKADLVYKKEPYGQSALLGVIEALKGYYTYLGNSFNLVSGRLTFTGENPPDPEIAAEAVHDERGRPYKVRFSASGRLRSPKIELTSDPALEQRDIISYLVTGVPLYELNSQGGAQGDNRAAQNLAAGYLSQKASVAVARKLELDMINLKVTGESQADVTVGRYVTKKLFVSYGQVLGPGGEKRVSAEYSLTRHLSLEGKNSSAGSYGADLLFKFGVR
ncbi:MAG: hypothetical protein CVU79_12425 [Elusimicrobia bacterium HGW-Elusimicrobia-3]|nr:MAG: hypothetical protein CVU79_12425 [Elusimicrobia bacterium HGW-Elusimicrobia-3]